MPETESMPRSPAYMLQSIFDSGAALDLLCSQFDCPGVSAVSREAKSLPAMLRIEENCLRFSSCFPKICFNLS